ncbi:MAG: hypothetical protein V1799_13110 [bacterium]
MQQEPSTIKLTLDLSITIIWLTIGVALCSLGFILPENSSEIWPALDAAGIAAIAFLLVLLVYVLRKPISPKLRFIMILGFFLFAGSVSYVWMSTKQRILAGQHFVAQTRRPIAEGYSYYKASEYLLRPLKEYHQQRSQKKKSLGSIFQEIYPNTYAGSHLYQPGNYDPMAEVIIHSVTPDTIVLQSRVINPYAHRARPFVISNSPNLIKIQFTLTAKGISYVSEL